MYRDPSLSPFFKAWFKDRTREEISEVLSDKIQCAPVLTEIELFNDPNVREREMLLELQHPKGFTYRTIASGMQFSETPTKVQTHPPSLGANSVEVLKDLGYTDYEINELLEEKITQTHN